MHVLIAFNTYLSRLLLSLSFHLLISVNIPILAGETSSFQVFLDGQEAPAAAGAAELPGVEPIYRYGTFENTDDG